MSKERLTVDPMRRLVDGGAGSAAELTAASLLARVPTPAPFGSVAMARTQTRLARPRYNRSLTVASAAAFLCAVVWLRYAPAPTTLPGSATQAFATVTGPVAPAELGAPAWRPIADDARFAALGAATVKRTGTRRLRLDAGRMLVSTGVGDVTIEARSATVIVASHTTAEVEVSQRNVRIAAYVGQVRVTWSDGRSTAVGQGTIVTFDHAVPIEEAPANSVAPAQHHKPEPPPPVEPPPETVQAPEAPVVDDVQLEADLLAKAISSLRRDHDAKAALLHVAAYDSRARSGAFDAEIRRIELQALLQLDRRAEALALLDQLHAPSERSNEELKVVRGELRSSAGRCVEALRDFEAVIATTSMDLAERALYGRASCRGLLHDIAGARRDLEIYLVRFPHGRSIDAARAALRGVR